jgi:hypothetical protein
MCEVLWVPRARPDQGTPYSDDDPEVRIVHKGGHFHGIDGGSIHHSGRQIVLKTRTETNSRQERRHPDRF